PSAVEEVNCLYENTTPYSVVWNTRNVAGLVTSRQAIASTTVTPFSNTWSYDSLGRVRSQVVVGGPLQTQIVREDVTYFGNDDPATMEQWLGVTDHKHFTYGYDLRHQIASVSESNNMFVAGYTYSDSGRFSSANEAAPTLPGGDVANRNVSYHYDG